MTIPAESRAFSFDTEFDDAGSVVRAGVFQAIKRAYLPTEVEALVAQARVEAREAALAESESIKALALSQIGQALASAMPTLAHAAQAHREQSAELALAAARVVAASAIERFPQVPLRAALEALGQEVDASPRLVLRTGALDDAGRAELERLCADAGFTGAVAFREDADLPLAAFQLEWADGRAAFDPADAFARMAEALNSALAAEAGHAEPMNEGTS